MAKHAWASAPPGQAYVANEIAPVLTDPAIGFAAEDSSGAGRADTPYVAEAFAGNHLR